MKLARTLAIASLLLAAATAQAGTIHPALEAELAQTPPDQPVSVIVNMRDQAPISELAAQLRYAKAGPVERHRTIIDALQSAAVTQDALKADLTAGVRGGSVLGYTGYWISNLMVVHALPSEIRRIAARPDVDVVELNFKAELIAPIGRRDPIEPSEKEAGSRGIGVTPGLRAIRAPEAWYQLGYNGTGRLIGSLDTGVDGNHPALATRWRGYMGQNPWQECWLDVLGTGTQFPSDGNSHGTHTTGTMTGLGVATQDTIGVAWGAQWIACNAINQNVSSGFDQDIITAFQWFADPDGNSGTVDDVPDVVQNSWRINEGFSGTPPYTDCDTRWWAVIDNCEAAGVVTTWSAGNEGPGAGTIGSPPDRATTLTNAFSVGAVSAQAGQTFPYAIADFSSRGPSGCAVPAPQKLKPEVCAPGVGVYSSVPGGGYESSGWNGTSMAGPHAAGIVALIRQANPGLGVDDIKTILMQTARDEGTIGEDNTFGWGFIDAQAAVIAATVGFGQLQGVVYNQSWGDAPLPGARVRLIETGAQFTTNGDGRYTGSAGAGDYSVEASLAGFQTASAQVTIVSDEITMQDFHLTDIAGPAITGVSQPGATTDAAGPYVIDATITDPSTVATATLYYRANNGPWLPAAMSLVGGGLYEASMPGQPVGTRIDYYVHAVDGPGLAAASPADAPASYYSLFITSVDYAYDAETPDASWQLGMTGDTATSGIWILADPVGTNWEGDPVQPEDDHTADPGVQCFVTANGAVGGAAGAADVDGGCTSLRTPIFDLSAVEQAFVCYWRWYGENGNSTDDEFAVDVSNDGGATWVPAERVPENQASWQRVAINLGSLVTLTDQMVVRFRACDLNTGGLVEAAIDDITVETFTPDVNAIADFTPGPVTGLEQNRPNPFRPGANLTSITFRLANPSDAKVVIFDAAGRQVRTLFQGPMRSGAHTLVWNGLDDSDREVEAGVYFYRLTAGAFEQSRRLTIVK